MVASHVSPLDRARYFAQRVGITAVTFPVMHTWHRLCHRHVGPAKNAAKALDDRYRGLLSRDIQNVDEGAYPAELLFQDPITEYLKLLPASVVEFPRIYW